MSDENKKNQNNEEHKEQEVIAGKKTVKEQLEDDGRKAGRLGIIPLILNGSRIFTSGFLSLLTGLLATVLILYSGYVLYDSFYTQSNAGSSSRHLQQYKPEILEDGTLPLSGGSLAAVNSDYRAWLTIDKTNIDYAVMQGPDDLYYASHDIYGESSITGAIYLASANSGGFTDQYNLVYGHHMDSNAMFGSLDNFLNEAYFDSHREGTLVTSGGVVYDLYTFAVIRTDAYESQIYNIAGKTAGGLLGFLQNYDGTVIYRDGVASTSSKIIAFSTCAAADTNGRLVVFAVMLPRDMTEVTNGDLTLRAKSYDGLYDGQFHSVEAEANDPDAVIDYSVDGGKTWTTEKPLLRDVGAVTVLVRATKGDNSVSMMILLRVSPAPVVVAADPASKLFGTEDPDFTATVTGLIGDDTVVYTVTRPGAGEDEEIGRYKDALIASGEELQGNYAVTYEPADFTVTDAETILDSEPPLARFVRSFEPRGGGGNAWALINLICVLITAYVTLPLLHLKAKFGRARLIEQIEEEENELALLEGREAVSFADVIKKFKRRFRIGFGSEILDVILAVVVFILTENMRAPMVLIDKWTPLMVVLMLVCWVIDVYAIRVRNSDLVKEERLIKRRIRKLKKAITMF